MHPLFDRVGGRIAPAILTAAGIVLIAAGLLTYTAPSGTDAQGSDTPSLDTPAPTGSLGLITFPPMATETPSPSAGATPSPSATPSNRVATRVQIPALDIDLPVVKPPSGFPYCNVAMYLGIFSQPGLPGATYLFAHARTGMFLPLLTHSYSNDGASMIGMRVLVYTSDDKLFWYKITRVRRHYSASNSLNDLPVKDGQLWLQTSEGPYSSSTKLQVVATFQSQEPASHADAHPKAHPVKCG